MGRPALRGRRSTAAAGSPLLRLGALLASAALLGACVEPPPPLAEPAGIEVIEDLALPELAAESLLRRAQEVTVRIRTLGCRQFGVGSGFVLPGGVVVTNRHVVDEPREVTVNTWDGRTIEAEVSGLAVDSDLAILQLADDTGLPEAELRTTPIEAGESIVAVGYPGGGPSTVSLGTALGLVDGELFGEPADVIQIDADIRQGNSGGPVLDMEGRVVGVVFALDASSGLGFAVPVTTLLERLDASELAPPAGC
jgi:S1-C subfamily serine protease